MKLGASDESQHNFIQQGFQTVDFHECANCGVIIVISEIDNDAYCIINAKALGLKSYSLDLIVKNYDGETVEDRLARRKKNWYR